jgi:hypothetical protein
VSASVGIAGRISAENYLKHLSVTASNAAAEGPSYTWFHSGVTQASCLVRHADILPEESRVERWVAQVVIMGVQIYRSR